MVLAQHPGTVQTCRCHLCCLRPAAHLRMPIRRLATGDGSFTVQRLVQDGLLPSASRTLPGSDGALTLRLRKSTGLTSFPPRGPACERCDISKWAMMPVQIADMQTCRAMLLTFHPLPMTVSVLLGNRSHEHNLFKSCGACHCTPLAANAQKDVCGSDLLLIVMHVCAI